jgi:hypothetical protein
MSSRGSEKAARRAGRTVTLELLATIRPRAGVGASKVPEAVGGGIVQKADGRRHAHRAPRPRSAGAARSRACALHICALALGGARRTAARAVARTLPRRLARRQSSTAYPRLDATNVLRLPNIGPACGLEGLRALTYIIFSSPERHSPVCLQEIAPALQGADMRRAALLPCGLRHCPTHVLEGAGDLHLFFMTLVNEPPGACG